MVVTPSAASSLAEALGFDTTPEDIETLMGFIGQEDEIPSMESPSGGSEIVTENPAFSNSGSGYMSNT